jgi:RNA ligase
MQLDNLVDMTLLEKHLLEGMVSCQKHPILPLQIYNYTHKAQYSPVWGDGTIDYCRGLIVDATNYEIIARPFKKFHNLNTASIPETLETNLPKTTPTIAKKYDGSLGILWQYGNDYGIATRGSFMSPQARWATKWLKDRVEGRVRLCPMDLPGDTTFTWLFEIVYPENRIVVSYPFEGLVLLGAVNKLDGWELPYSAVENVGRIRGFRVAERIKDKNIFDCMQDNNPNEEGYVVTYPLGAGKDPLKVKIKMADYLRLHRVITGMNPRSVWELLKEKKPFDRRFDGCPADFMAWLNKWVEKLNSEFDKIAADTNDLYVNRPIEDGTDHRRYRAECAAYFFRQNRPELKSIFFLMLDGKNVDEAIWNMLEPRGDDKTFRTEEE